MQKAFGALFGIVLLLGCFGTLILSGVKTWRTDGITTENHLVITTAGVTTANLTLEKELFQSQLSQIDEITSSDEADTPVATEYDEDNQVLTVGGLNDDATRTLAVDYYGLNDNVVMLAIGGFLGVGIIGFILVMLVKEGFFGGKKGFNRNRG
jgi:hypothetical protein